MQVQPTFEGREMKKLAEISTRDSNSFGLVRLIAATLVVVSHGYLLTGGAMEAEPFSVSTSFPLGAHAVHIFFALSGFLIAASWQSRPEALHFFAGRFLRLYPALIAVTLAVLVIAALFLSQPMNLLYPFSPEAILFFGRTVFLLDGGGSIASVLPQDEISGAILATVWTLRFEVLCYLTIPVFMTLVGKRKDVLGISAALLLVVAGVWLVTRNAHYLQMGFLDSLARFMFAFYLGVLAWIFRNHIPISGFVLAALAVAAFTGLGTRLSQPLEILAIAYFTFWVGSFHFGALTDAANREDLSYGIYLMGYPIQQAALGLLPGDHQSAWTNISVTMLIAVPLAFASWRLLERPALQHRAALVSLGAARFSGKK